MTATEHEPRLLRELIQEPEYVEAVAQLFGSIRRADDILAGLEFYISRRAEFGMAVYGYPPNEFASWVSTLLPGDVRVRVVYRFDEVSVSLLDAWLVPGFAPERPF